MSTTDNNTGSFADIFGTSGGGGGSTTTPSAMDIRVTGGTTPDADHINLSLTDGSNVLVDATLLKDKLIKHTTDVTVAQATTDWANA